MPTQRHNKEETLARHAAKVDYLSAAGCWTWLGQTCNWGYGIISHNSKRYGAHRFVYEALVGPVPEGMVVDHICRNRLCVNPMHLQVTTFSNNVALGKLRNTHCPNGHEFSEENTYLRPDNDTRQCRQCKRESNAKQYLKRKAAV